MDGTRDLTSSDSDYPPARYEDVKSDRRNAGNRPRAPANFAGKIAISNPVIAATHDVHNPLSRIPTVDLATAAENDRRQRAADLRRVAEMQRTASLQRPSRAPAAIAPPLPSIPAEAPGDMAFAGWQAGGPYTGPAGNDLARTDSEKSNQSAMLSVQGNALSSSTQLSPGADALRRRSPRQSQPNPTAAPFEIVQPGESVRIPIPRAPERAASSASSKSRAMTSTTLQRRPTNGLPANPRTPGMRNVMKHARSQTEQAVMLVNNFTYNDPEAVAGALKRSNTEGKKPFDPRTSVVHRPRPIPRKSDKDRQVFPAEVSPASGAHRRTKSSGSVITRKKSILKSRPGSPTQLPPLPPPPKSAGAPSRPLPNNTRSMTFDEKMELFYAPPISAIPSIPTMNAGSDVDNVRARSIVESESSVRTTSVLEVPHEPQLPIAQDKEEEDTLPPMPVVSRWSDDPSQSDNEPRHSQAVPNRQSNMTSVRDEDAMTNWGSVHSPVAAVNVSQARQNARSTYIQKDRNLAEKPIAEEAVPVMLEALPAATNPPQAGPEEVIEASESSTQKRHSPRQFHHRVGDECPTFSGRTKAQSRKMPPPAPLLLNVKDNNKAIVVQSTEHSPDSPEAVYQMIQDQLRTLEELNEEYDDSEVQRLALLENLEREMAGQENKWQSMQGNIQRDSMSTVKTTPRGTSRPASTVVAPTQDSSQKFNTPDGIAARRASRRSIGSVLSRDSRGPELLMKRNNQSILAVSKASLGSPTPPETDESDFEVEEEPVLATTNPVTPEAVQVHALWQPMMLNGATYNSGLWRASLVIPKNFPGNYELPGMDLRPKQRKTAEPLTIESSQLWQRRMWTSELNETSGLWQKQVPIERQQAQKSANRPLTIRPPRKNKRVTALPDILESPEPLDRRGTLGIFRFPWGEKSESATVQQRASQFMAMPGTMTTGAPTINAILMARASQIPSATAEEGSSYFDEFDEESGDNFDDFSDGEGDEFDETTLWEIADLLQTEGVLSDSMLTPPPCPQPCPSSERVDSFILDGSLGIPSDDECEGEDEAEEENETDEQSLVEFEMISEENVSVENSPVVFFKPTPVRSHLWAPICPAILEATPSFGITQPTEEIWAAYVAEASSATFSRSRKEGGEVLPIQSTTLWTPSAQNVYVSFSTGLWAKLSAFTGAQSTAIETVSKTSLLWNEPSLPPSSPMDGLFNTASRRSNYRRTSAEPAALNMTRAPRFLREPLPQLAATSLWSAPETEAATSESSLLHPSMRRASPSGSATSKLLWSQPAAAPKQVSDGLFSTEFKRLDYRRTSQPPAALSMTRKPSIRREPVPELASPAMWTVQTVSKPAPAPGKPSLWTKTVPTVSTAPSLFKIDPTRKVYRTTTAEPAALHMEKKPRKLQGPLLEVESNSLWNINNRLSVEVDWLSISSIRPSSPSMASASSDSSASSPVSDAFSFKTSVTKASSVATGSIVGAWSAKSRYSAVPEVPVLPMAFVNKNLNMVQPPKPAPNPAKRPIRRASAAVWDMELYAAIIASGIQQRKLTRKTASPWEWSAALNAAIAASYPPKPVVPVATAPVATAPAVPAAPTPLLWTKPATLSAEAPKALWTASPATRSGADVASVAEPVAELRQQRTRKSSETTDFEISPDFRSQRMWQRSDATPSKGLRSRARDWLDDTTKRRFSRLELRY